MIHEQGKWRDKHGKGKHQPLGHSPDTKMHQVNRRNIERCGEEQQNKARITGLALAMIARILLLFSIVWIMKLTLPLFTMLGQEISGRDLILIGGGLFLLAKSTFEIHDKLEGEEHTKVKKGVKSFASVIIQILLLDLVFSLDSVITAVGMAKELGVDAL